MHNKKMKGCSAFALCIVWQKIFVCVRAFSFAAWVELLMAASRFPIKSWNGWLGTLRKRRVCESEGASFILLCS